jgi:succinate dehydrogenase / fumarate reductase cytochrome b subunit
MALSGLVMVGFVVGHLVGNLQIFQSPDHINGYAAFLHQLGPTLWFFRIGLIVSVGLHIWAATSLTLENKRARGPEPYAVKTWLQASLASRAVRWTGYIVLAFLAYHLAHFTLGVAGADDFKSNLPAYTLQEDYRVAGVLAVEAGTAVPDVHSMVILGFQNAAVSLFYIIAVGLLSFHLLHGIDSLFQTLGWRSTRWAGVLRGVARVFCVAYFIGNLLIPAAVLSGAKGLREGFAREAARPTTVQR